MKTSRLAGLLIFLALNETLLAAAAAPPPAKETKPIVPAGLGTRFKQVRDRIDSLFQHRLEPPAPFDPSTNPFRAPGTVSIPVPSPEKPGDPAPVSPEANSLSLLQQAAATFKVSGVFEKDNRSHLVINGRTYKEGDAVPAVVQGETVYVRLREIVKGHVTLVLHDAELTLKF